MAGIMKGDLYFKEISKEILENGSKDINPRPKWADGTPAHTLSVNHKLLTYDIAAGEFPLVSLRPIATKMSIGEILWIWQDASNDLDLLKEKYGVSWWDEWDIGNRTIGACYGETVRRRDMMRKTLENIKKDPDGRRHINCLWQEDDFKEPHGLKPCFYEHVFSVTHKEDGDYLDMMLHGRSSDWYMAGAINQIQYLVLQHMVARHCNLKVGRFSMLLTNVQVYDRHMEQVKEMLEREPIECSPSIWINPDKTDFYDITIDDIKIIGYPMDEIKEKNPGFKDVPIAI